MMVPGWGNVYETVATGLTGEHCLSQLRLHCNLVTFLFEAEGTRHTVARVEPSEGQNRMMRETISIPSRNALEWPLHLVEQQVGRCDLNPLNQSQMRK
jgi:hypothetical protein